MAITPSVVLLFVIVIITRGFWLSRRFRRAVIYVVAVVLYALSKPIEKAILFWANLPESPVAQRRTAVVIRKILGIIVIATSAYLTWYEFGVDIFKSPMLLLLIVIWGLFGIDILLEEWDRCWYNNPHGLDGQRKLVILH